MVFSLDKKHRWQRKSEYFSYTLCVMRKTTIELFWLSTFSIYFFFKSARSDLFWIKCRILNKMQNSQSKSSAFLLELYRLKCNSICIHHHSKKQQTRQKTRLYSPSWVDWWTTKCCKWSASTELNLICWKIDKNGHVAGTAKDSCQAYHFCNKQPKPAISWCMEI